MFIILSEYFTKDPRFCQTAQVFKKMKNFDIFSTFLGFFPKMAIFQKGGGFLETGATFSEKGGINCI